MNDRIPLDHLTSDQYDELCNDLDEYERIQGDMNDRAIDLTRRAETAEKELRETQWRHQDAERRVRCQRERAERAEAALVRPGLVPDDSSVTDIDPAWTPPPPGDKREQLPDALLALIDVPPYTSTACEAATLLARQMPTHTHRRIELGDHSDRLHDRCRRNNKFTGALCGCHCHA